MKIAIIGAGGVGSTLGHAWRRRGHEVTYGVPEPHAAKYASLDGDVTTNQHAAKAADAVVLCTPWQATEQALADCGDSAGKVLIDCTNPLSPDSTSLGSGTARPAPSRWPVGRRVRGYVKALNQIGAPMMDAPALSATPVMFVCGDDVEAKTSPPDSSPNSTSRSSTQVIRSG